MRLSASRFVGLALIGLGALSLNVCGGGGGDSPGVPTQPTAPPVATPTPVPTSEPPLSASCAKLPAGSATPSCKTDQADFQSQVDEAIRTLQGEQPQIFQGDQVLSAGAYYVGLIKILDRKGLCAATEGEELGVANSASYNEQYDVLSAKGGARFGPVSYRVTCSPSAVPLPSPGLPPQQAGCPLAPSREIACGRDPEGKYYGEVEAAISQILKDKPGLFDFSDVAPGTDFVRIRDLDGYNRGMVDIMTSKGFCAKHDGEELALKRGSNSSSEQYDVDLQGGQYIRRGPGIYRVSCYPAAF
jgi:hypothetical protein